MTSLWSGAQRARRLADMQEREFDVLIIGGGITGAGIALDAAARGLRTALVDMQDFAAGTSSRSTKLVHGGLRYLKNLEIGVVAEVGKERAIVYENGPHITTPERMLLPIYRGGTFGRFSTSVGLLVYDFLAGVKKEERRRMLSAEQTLAHEPLLKRENLLGGGSYVEYRTDDARLTLEVLKKAVELGAVAVNYAKVESLLRDADGRVRGARVEDCAGSGGTAYVLKARYVVNAAGPWVDQLREMDRSKTGKTLHLTKGVHVVFDGKRFPLRQAVYFDTPDGRMVFAIPRDGKTYVGTTDTNYAGDLANPRITPEDRDYLLDAARGMFPDLKLTSGDIESGWCGLRPLVHQEGKDPSEISRRDEIFESPSGLLSIAGGKLTGYRKMAESIVDRIAARMREAGDAHVPSCMTKELRLSGGDVGGSAGFPAFVREWTGTGVRLGLTHAAAEALVRRYGSNAAHVFAYAAGEGGGAPGGVSGGAGDREDAVHGDGSDSGDGRADGMYGGVSDSGDGHADAAAVSSPASTIDLPDEIRWPLDYAIDREMAVKPVDFFIRRTGALLFDKAWVLRWKDAVIAHMAERLAYSPDEKRAYAEELEEELRHAQLG